MGEMSKRENKGIGDAELILYHYGEAPYDTPAARVEMEQQLAESAELRMSYEALVALLEAVNTAPVPVRDEAYGRRVWNQIAPKLEAKPRWNWREWFAPRRLALAGSMAALILTAFLVGKYWSPRGPDLAGDGRPPVEVRERILLVAVGDHLEKSQMVLVELANAQPNGTLNIASEQRRAGDLVAANRLYRQTAARAGEVNVATLLEELERVLIEIANSPSELSGPQLERIQKRIEAQGILFKVRVIESQVRERERAPMTPQQGQGKS